MNRKPSVRIFDQASKYVMFPVKVWVYNLNSLLRRTTIVSKHQARKHIDICSFDVVKPLTHFIWNDCNDKPYVYGKIV